MTTDVVGVEEVPSAGSSPSFGGENTPRQPSAPPRAISNRSRRRALNGPGSHENSRLAAIASRRVAEAKGGCTGSESTPAQ